MDQYRYQIHRSLCGIAQYSNIEEVSYRNHIVSSNISQIIWPKICKSLWISGFIGFLYIEWDGSPVTKVFWWVMKMKILWMLVVIASQPDAALPQFWIFPSTSHCDTLIDFSWLIILITRFFITFWINVLLHIQDTSGPSSRPKQKYKSRSSSMVLPSILKATTCLPRMAILP